MTSSGVPPTSDWEEWHRGYDDPGSVLSERLLVVQRHIRAWLDATAPRSVRVMSSCAGDGRDLLDVLAERADAHRVTATLLEADVRNADRARQRVGDLGLEGVEVRCTDAGISDAYAGAVPADLVLLCGIFGNVPDEDVRRTISAARQFCDAGARVIWTRHRRYPDLTPKIHACSTSTVLRRWTSSLLHTPCTRWGSTGLSALLSRWRRAGVCSPS